MKKRGLSPVIATVFMILLVLVLATLIFLWARGFLSEQIEKFGQPIDNLCKRVDFEVQRVRGEVGPDALEVVNRGDINIFHLDIKLLKDGNSEISRFKFKIDAGQSIRKDLSLRMKDGSLPDKIEIMPALLGTVEGKDSNKAFTCKDASKTINM
ncbi:MAG: archaellin/type IV pilin N-terminal domain-containing protein [Nanoarchaeota archaeon]|nr:archaellin/type IV pilin N-terminal domain-containing protein [Nanoarchaeota archaeon]